MKTKVLIVDDEKLERVLIRKGFDWEANGFEIIGEASNGEEALDFFELKQPDLVLTDINMPFMDGLELAQELMKRSKLCRVIIITGYREFDYARRAIKLGVKDFLLKPVNISDMVETVKNIQKEIEKQRDQNQEYSKLKASVSENHEIVIESFLQRLVEGRIEEEDAIHKLQLYSFESLLEHSCCLNIKPAFSKDTTEDEKMVLCKEVLSIVNEVCTDDKVSFIHFMCNVIVFLTGENLKDTEDIAARIHDSLNASDKNAIIGISEIQTAYKGIAKGYEQTKKAIATSIIIGEDKCIHYREYKKIKQTSQSKNTINWQDFTFSVENGLESKVYGYVEEFTGSIRAEGITNTDYLKLSAMNMLTKASIVLTKCGKSLEQIVGDKDLYAQLSNIETVDEMKSYLDEVLSQILNFSNSIRNKKSNKLIDQAVEYIDGHLYESNLTLKRVAKEVFVNESYLSRVFKQEKGESLIEYITRKRIEQSIELLNTTDLKVYEIAEKVGINDPHYFSICFKKQVGVTIKEYKKSK